jgi:hypothetical protein
MPAGYLTILQFAKAHQRSQNTVRRWCQRGHLPGAHKVGYTWLIPDTATPPVLPQGRPLAATPKETK